MNRMTLAQARAHFGMSDAASEAAIRAAAAADEIEIIDEADASDGDRLTDSIRNVTDVADRLTAAIEAQGGRATDDQADLGRRAASVLTDAAAAGIGTPSRRESGPRVQVFDRFDQMGYTRGDFELAGMIFGGTQSGQVRTNPVAMPEDFRRAWEHHVFSDPSRRPWLADSDGNPTRAMDTAESGFGADLIGVQYGRDLWAAARNDDALVQRIPQITMADATMNMPIDGALPEMLFVGESTAQDASAYGTSKTASSKRQLAAKKFTIQQIWSGELNEDSIIAFTPFLRRQMNISATLHLGSAMYNGDTTNAGTGNINSDDADPADTKHYLAFDGIRHYWLVDATGQGKDMAGALDPKELWRARGKLNGTDDDIDAAVGNINWGTRAADLVTVADWDTFMELHDSPDFATVDKYGAQATIVTGELGRVNGMPVVSPGYASKTEADGKASGTEASNVKGQITVFNPNGFMMGVRREMQLYFDRVQRTDQFLFELYTRVAFNRWGGNVAAGIYDIDVSE